MVQLERKQRITLLFTPRFENIEMYEIDYSLAWKLEKWKQTICSNNVSSTNMSYFYVINEMQVMMTHFRLIV